MGLSWSFLWRPQRHDGSVIKRCDNVLQDLLFVMSVHYLLGFSPSGLNNIYSIVQIIQEFQPHIPVALPKCLIVIKLHRLSKQNQACHLSPIVLSINEKWTPAEVRHWQIRFKTFALQDKCGWGLRSESMRGSAYIDGGTGENNQADYYV